jgi:hypothetical protein
MHHRYGRECEHITHIANFYVTKTATAILSHKYYPSKNCGMSALTVLTKVLYHLPAATCENAYLFHNAIENALRKQGWAVIREFQVRNGSNRRIGYIDLVVTRPIRIALELDRNTPRKKSLMKLSQFKGLRFVILRRGRRIIPVDDNPGN